MQTYTYYMSIEVRALNDESAENKLEKFLSGLDLKKNDNLKLTSLEFDDGEGEESAKSDDSKAASTKKKRPPLRLPKNAASEWNEDDEDVDWDSLDEEETESPGKAAPVEESAEDSDDEDWDWEDEDGEWEDDDSDDSDDSDNDSGDEEIDEIEAMLSGIE